MRVSHRFRPDAPGPLEGRRVPALFPAGNFLSPIAADLATNAGTLGSGNQFVPALYGLTANVTGLANPVYLNGLGFNNMSGFTGGLSPVGILATNGGPVGAGSIPSTSGTLSFTGSQYAPTAPAIQYGLYPAAVQPTGGSNYFAGVGSTPAAVTNVPGSDFYASNYTSGLSYLNGLGANSGFGSGTALGFSNGLGTLTTLGTNSGSLSGTASGTFLGFGSTDALTTNGFSLNGGLGASFGPYAPQGPVGLVSPASPYVTQGPVGLVTPASPYVTQGPVGIGLGLSSSPFVNMTGFNSTFATSPFVNTNGFAGLPGSTLI